MHYTRDLRKEPSGETRTSWLLEAPGHMHGALSWVAAAEVVAAQSTPVHPDIVILLTDQQRAAATGARTPAMDRLAREGVLFTRAFCATPQCSPSRAALLTGRYPHRTGVMGNVQETRARNPPAGMSPPLDPAIPGLGRIFSAAGYDTAYFGKWHLGKTPASHGFEIHDTAQRGDRHVTLRVLDFLKQRSASTRRRPLLLVVSWLNPHDIYEIAREPEVELNAAERIPLPKSLSDDLSTKPFPQKHYLEADQGKPFRRYAPEAWRRYLTFYSRLLEQVDSEIGAVLDDLRKMHPSPVIILSSDHGDLGGAHGLPFKGPAMYEELVRVPLVISWQRKIPPRVSSGLVSLIDILPTLCDLAGVNVQGGVDGRSLSPLLRRASPVKTGNTSWRDAVFAEYYGKQDWRVPIRMVRTNSWKYVRYLRYGEELYDLTADPHELKNLAGDPRHRKIQAELAARLDHWMAASADPFLRLTVTDRSGRVF